MNDQKLLNTEMVDPEVTESTADESCCSESTLSHEFDGFSYDSHEEDDKDEDETEHSEMNEFLPPLPCITISTSLSASLTPSRRTSESSTSDESGILSVDSTDLLCPPSTIHTSASTSNTMTPQRRLSRTDSRRSATMSSSKAADPLSSSSAHLRRSSFRSSRGLCRTTSNQNSLHELYTMAQESSSIMGRTGSSDSLRMSNTTATSSLDGPSNHSLRSFLYVPPPPEGDQRIESLCDILDSALEATSQD